MSKAVTVGVKTFAAIMTPEVLTAADVVAKRILAGDSAPEKLARTVADAVSSGTDESPLKSIDACKAAVRFVLHLSDCPRSVAKTVSERNRWDYYFRTSAQLLAERLGLATSQQNVFSLTDYLGRVVNTLKKHKVAEAIVADVSDALRMALDAENGVQTYPGVDDPETATEITDPTPAAAE